MLIKRNRPGKFGTMFAVWPRWTPDGWVALEWLWWERIDGWGWGSGDTYRYARFVPDKAYDEGERRKFLTPKVTLTYPHVCPPGFKSWGCDDDKRDMGTRMMGCGDD